MKVFVIVILSLIALALVLNIVFPILILVGVFVLAYTFLKNRTTIRIIHAKEERLYKEYKNEIVRLNSPFNKVFCPYCNKKVNRDNGVCPYCGATIF